MLANLRCWSAIGGITVLAILLSLVRYTPPRLTPEVVDNPQIVQTSRAVWLARQLRDPAVQAPEMPNALRWRLLPPVVGHALGLSVPVFLLLPAAGAVLLLGVTTRLAQRVTQSWPAVFFTAIIAATSSAFFVATGWLAQFDAFYLLALLGVAFAERALVIGLLCALGPWCDERFLLALPVCLLVRGVRRGGIYRDMIWPVALGLLPYLACRGWAVLRHEPSVAAQLRMQQEGYGRYLSQELLGWWMGFRAGWVLVLSALVALWREQRLLTILALVAGIGGTTLLAWDVSRSAAILWPCLVYGTWRLHQAWPVQAWKILGVLALLNLLLPACHVVDTMQIPIRSHPATLLDVQALRDALEQVARAAP